MLVGDIIGILKEGEAKQSSNKASSESSTVTSSMNNIASNNSLSPAPKKIAAENNIDTTKIAGTGKDGRVTKGDVLNEIGNQSNSNYSDDKPTQRVKMSKLRQKIAERLKESQNNAAILTTFNEVDMSAIMQIRKQYKDIFEKKHNIKLGFMSFFVKACIVALKEIPAVNAEIEGNDIIYKNYYDIGIAVGSPQGLVVRFLEMLIKEIWQKLKKKLSILAQKHVMAI